MSAKEVSRKQPVHSSGLNGPGEVTAFLSIMAHHMLVRSFLQTKVHLIHFWLFVKLMDVLAWIGQIKKMHVLTL